MCKRPDGRIGDECDIDRSRVEIVMWQVQCLAARKAGGKAFLPLGILRLTELADQQYAHDVIARLESREALSDGPPHLACPLRLRETRKDSGRGPARLSRTAGPRWWCVRSHASPFGTGADRGRRPPAVTPPKPLPRLSAGLFLIGMQSNREKIANFL